MIINQKELLSLAPIKDMLPTKERLHGVSHGLSEAGYDIRVKQEIIFKPGMTMGPTIEVNGELEYGRFCLASAIEEFDMPANLVGVVHDKSTWARQGLSVFNTVIEPGFKGGLTLELVYHGSELLHIPAGAGIAQVLFTRITIPAQYTGKYQGQSTDPVDAIFEK